MVSKYFFAWVNNSESYIEYWALIDVNILRNKKILDLNPKDDIRVSFEDNHDGTKFKAFHMSTT